MRCAIDMIHHNPGEKPFDTRFSDPDHLKAYGYNGQAFKHINTVASLEAVAPGMFPGNDEERAWLNSFTADRETEIREAKAAGLEVFYHIDLFVLPKPIVDHFKDEITDPETGRISLNRPMTLKLHRALFDEIFSRYPEIDGFIVRVGETYLYDTPYHTGNGAVHYHPDIPVEAKQDEFVTLLHFLREEICEKHGKILIHRTWDTWPNRFHSSREFYLAVTDRIETHPNLIFSIKHTQVDFHRWVPFNPCLTAGKHPQVIEAQCQREYEGKGAYPNYAIRGVIEGFAEPGSEQGIHEIADHPLIRGIYTWSRGGGWYGPMVNRENELWCDLNAYVIAQYAGNPRRSEAEIFHQYCTDILQLNAADEAIFRDIALSSLDAVVKGKCCAAWDSVTENRITYPTNQWMRDDVLHGLDKLGPVFDYLIQSGLSGEAIDEKKKSVVIWQHMRRRCNDFSMEAPREVRTVVTTSVEYGLRLFTAIAAAWEALLTGHDNPAAPELPEKLTAFRDAWSHYEQLPEEAPGCPTLYRPVGWSWPGDPTPAGLIDSINSLSDQ